MVLFYALFWAKKIIQYLKGINIYLFIVYENERALPFFPLSRSQKFAIFIHLSWSRFKDKNVFKVNLLLYIILFGFQSRFIHTVIL